MRAVSSSSSDTAMPVWSSMRSAADPTCNSARALRSVQSRSPLVSGRFGTTSYQLSSPAGEKLTVPWWKLRRATRPGGSCWAKAANPVKSSARPSSQPAARRPDVEVVRCFMARSLMTPPLTRERGRRWHPHCKALANIACRRNLM